MSEMRCAYTIFLIVTCYLLPVDILLHNASVVPPLYIRCTSVPNPFQVRSGTIGSAKEERRIIGVTTDLLGRQKGRRELHLR